MVKLRYPLLFLLAIAGMGLAFFATQPQLPDQADYYPSGGRDINDFHLTDANGQPFNPASLQRHWTFLFVGYTFCPDICPTTLADLRSVYDQLKQVAPSSQVMFISADPQRDDSARLKSYTAFFHPEFKAATGSHDKLFPFVRNLGLVYSIADQGEKDYLVDHSASIVLINPAGKLQAVFRPKIAPGAVPRVDMATMVSDFARIVTLANNSD
ncbi:SCO family protein [Aeromonas cavernicola]|uniref:SCO family protein n=1 Tax=Aeromonas cavernicola TaxID=1006623 RepID=A0A2H9U3G5_9GAMM|nr:SCO family protein [Aeromonas cavernicola]PJG58570.1 SCO family protein [Aeromonas cavernicola]